MRPHLVFAGVGACLALAACVNVETTDGRGGTGSETDRTGIEQPSAAPTEAGPGVDLGDQLDPASFNPRGVGIAWQVADGVLLTTTAGTPHGHLPGWTLDRGASDRLATAVVASPDGAVMAMTADGVVEATGPIPLANGTSLRIDGVDAVVEDRGGDQLTTLDAGDLTQLWVSATGSVVVAQDGAYDIEEATTTTVPNGCHVADRHTVDAPLLVCDGGTRLAGGIDATTPQGTRFGWVTMGTTGNEAIANLHTGDSARPVMVLIARGADEVTELAPGPDGGAALAYRSNGMAWVAQFGAQGGLDTLDPTGNFERLRDIPGATDAMMWLR